MEVGCGVYGKRGEERKNKRMQGRENRRREAWWRMVWTKEASSPVFFSFSILLFSLPPIFHFSIMFYFFFPCLISLLPICIYRISFRIIFVRLSWPFLYFSLAPFHFSSPSLSSLIHGFHRVSLSRPCLSCLLSLLVLILHPFSIPPPLPPSPFPCWPYSKDECLITIHDRHPPPPSLHPPPPPPTFSPSSPSISPWRYVRIRGWASVHPC